MSNNETHHICVGIRYNTLKNAKQHRMRGKGEEVQWRGLQ
jgi:hypothetical protein